MPSCGSGACFISYLETRIEWQSTSTLTILNSALANEEAVTDILSNQNPYRDMRSLGQIVINDQTYLPGFSDTNTTCCSGATISKGFVNAYQTYSQSTLTTGTNGGPVTTSMWRNLTMTPSATSSNFPPNCTDFRLKNFAPIEESAPIITTLLPSPCSILSSVVTWNPLPVVLTVDEAATSLYNTIGTSSTSGGIEYFYPYIPPASK